MIIDSLGSGGAQRQFSILANGLAEKGFFVTIIVYYDEPFFEDKFKYSNINVVKFLGLTRISRFLKISNYVRGNNPDVVISFLDGPNLIAIFSTMFLSKCKVIVSERNANPSIIKSLKDIVLRFFLGRADYVVSNSYKAVELFKIVNPIISDYKLKVIYNAIDFDLNNFDKILYNKSSNEHFVNVLVVASYQSSKNVFGLIESINLLPKNYVDKLRIVWIGGERDKHTKSIALDLINSYNLNKTIFLESESKEIYKLMLQFDVIGLFSFYEGLPNAICEAMSLGKPVICSNVSDLHRFIDSKFLFNPHSNIEIANTFKYIVDMKSEFLNIGEANKSVATKLFSRNDFIENFVRLFN